MTHTYRRPTDRPTSRDASHLKKLVKSDILRYKQFSGGGVKKNIFSKKEKNMIFLFLNFACFKHELK